MTDQNKVRDIGKGIRDSRKARRVELERVLSGDQAAVTEFLKTKPEVLAEILALAAHDLSGGGMTGDETHQVAESLAGQPAMLARLLSGMQA